MSYYSDSNGSMREGTPDFSYLSIFLAEADRPGPGEGPSDWPAGSTPDRPLPG